MPHTYALVPIDASAEEIKAAGVDPTAERHAPPLGYLHSDDVSIWVGIEPVEGRISLDSAARGAFRTWVSQNHNNEAVLVNTSRLIAIRLSD